MPDKMSIMVRNVDVEIYFKTKAQIEMNKAMGKPKKPMGPVISEALADWLKKQT